MAGSDPRFDSAKFRDAIHFAMRMAFPEDVSRQITWHWTPSRTYDNADSGGFPLKWDAANVVSEVDVDDLIVDCVVKFAVAGNTTRVGGTALGIMDIANATVTLLDVDHDALVVHGNGVFPDQAVLDGNVYVVQIVAPPYALFDVTVWDVYLQAIDES